MFYVACLCTRAKVLYFDGTGLCLLHKRLSKGRFAAPWRDAQDTEWSLSPSELQLFLEGCALVGKRPLSPAPLSPAQYMQFAEKGTVAVRMLVARERLGEDGGPEVEPLRNLVELIGRDDDVAGEGAVGADAREAELFADVRPWAACFNV